MSNYPGSLDTTSNLPANLTADTPTNDPDHGGQHNLVNGAIVALETKLGTGASTPGTAGHVLTDTGTGSSWQALPSTSLTSGVTGTLPITNGGTGATTNAGARSTLGAAESGVNNDITELVALSNTGISVLAAAIGALLFPVGCIYTETTGTNPGTTFGFGTWVAYGAGRVLVGNGTSDEAFAAGATGGESNHTLTTSEMPSHTHGYSYLGAFQKPQGTGPNTAASIDTVSSNTGSAGSGSAHNNLQPYIVVYFWERTA